MSRKVTQPIAPFSSEYSAEMDDKTERHSQMMALAERLTSRVATALEQTPDVA